VYAGQKDVKKVVFIIPTLGGGGAERVFLHIIRNLDRSKFIPLVVLFEEKGELLSELPADIGLTILKQDAGTYKMYGTVFIKLARQLSRLMRNERPDTVVSFMWYTNFVTLIARILSRISVKVIVSERYGLAVSFEGKMVEFLRGLAIRFFYPGADMVIVNSRVMGKQLKEMFHIHEGKIAAIYNPVDINKISIMAVEDAEHAWFREHIPIITGIGRFTRQKGFDYLIKAVHRLNGDGAECRLVLLGKGPEEGNLKKLATDLGIDDKVLFPGFQQNPYKYLARATIFVLSSFYEGFPNVLLEAIALGIPSVATRCPTGPDEIITDGKNGLLVPPGDHVTLGTAIRKLLQDKSMRCQFSEAGKRRAQDFEVKNIVRQYEKTIENVCGGSVEKLTPTA